ncbi:MAG: F0F1 ATP synthase subunit delta [Oceanicaulis sp.]
MTTQTDAITGETGERYARALFELAEEAGELQAVESDVDALQAAIGESADLRRALASPVYKTVEKAAALNALAGSLGLHTMTGRFLGVVANNGRSAELPKILRAFKALAAKKRGSATAEIVTADALTQAQLKELTTALKTALGRDVEVRTEVREDIIGGLIVKVGSRMFDSSLKTKLEGLRKTMKEA